MTAETSCELFSRYTHIWVYAFVDVEAENILLRKHNFRHPQMKYMPHNRSRGQQHDLLCVPFPD